MVLESAANTTTALIGPLTEFLLFPKLQPELQLMIWECALPGPRLIAVEIHIQHYGEEIDPGLELRSRYQQSGLLRACQESRKTFLKAFPDTLSVNSSGSSAQASNKLFFNRTSDVVYLGNLWDLVPSYESSTLIEEAIIQSLQAKFSGGIQHLAIDTLHVCHLDSSWITKVATRFLFKDIKTFTILTYARGIRGLDMAELLQIAKIHEQDGSWAVKWSELAAANIKRDNGAFDFFGSGESFSAAVIGDGIDVFFKDVNDACNSVGTNLVSPVRLLKLEA